MKPLDVSLGLSSTCLPFVKLCYGWDEDASSASRCWSWRGVSGAYGKEHEACGMQHIHSSFFFCYFGGLYLGWNLAIRV